MSLYSIKNKDLFRIKKADYKKEKEIQSLTEKNLKQLFGLDFIKSEFSLKNFRIDTLAFDSETKSFVIIEYKKSRNSSVSDQGLSYLQLLFNNQADFILEYNENMKNNLKRKDVDWSQSKVIIVSPLFTTYQVNSINFKDLPIELWTVTKFENDTIMYNKIKSQNPVESINMLSISKNEVKKVTEQITVYDEEYHMKNKGSTDAVIDLYNDLKENILLLDPDISLKFTKTYIAFKANTNFVDILLQKSQIKFWLNLKKGTLIDNNKVSRDVSTIGHLGNGDYQIILQPEDDLNYIMTLIKQAYESNK
jgi:predicted transport protein